MDIKIKTKILRDTIENKYIKVSELEPTIPITGKQKDLFIRHLGLDKFDITPDLVFNFCYNSNLLFTLLSGTVPLLGDIGVKKDYKKYAYKEVDFFTLSELSKEEFNYLIEPNLFVKDWELNKILNINSQGVYEQNKNAIAPNETYFKSLEGTNILNIFYHRLQPLEYVFTLSL